MELREFHQLSCIRDCRVFSQVTVKSRNLTVSDTACSTFNTRRKTSDTVRHSHCDITSQSTATAVDCLRNHTIYIHSMTIISMVLSLIHI